MSVAPAPSSASQPGGSAATGGHAPLAQAAKPVQPGQLAAGAASVPQPPALFGGHKGGGKKRADGLVAGSAEAKAADRERDAARKRAERAAKKGAALPPALPSANAAAANAPAAVPAAASPQPGPVAAAPVVSAVVPGIAPTYVPWTEKILSRPIRLLTRIIDRMRVSSLMHRVRRLALKKEQEQEIERSIEYKAEAVADFNTAVSNCLSIELNKRNVPGAQHSHWLDVLMTGGELVHCHLDTVDKLEKMIAANEAERQKAAKAKPAEPAPNLKPAPNTPSAVLGSN